MSYQPLTRKITKHQSQINSQISPWVSHLLYSLGSYFIIPTFFGEIKITGQENIPPSNPVIVAPTHRSRWDAFIIPYTVGRLVSGRDLRFMVSANEAKGLQGWFVRRMGCFPVDIQHPKAGSIIHSVELLQDNDMVVIFPEGGIFRDDKVHKLKRGAAFIALEFQLQQPHKQVEILPITIRYSQPYPSWQTNIAVDIGMPLRVSDYLKDSLRKSSQKLTQSLQAKLQEMSEKNTCDRI
ncbi:1-acyl-sn-glycerol-3-phosphate acyltransferase [Xenococcus sp. PCC 7305]|uniref:lysophospholipid acyltransferase family protein n=1 Tax=Xenococcus sp. PCC 7305 TaxID=102125 RepID=UPI0002ABEC3B|nr:1-acyl-sn-glycerol-3-phosphate acyltransferase [Xenococcus sp. PCC 7305]ELS03216.1 1-acyl-sn-glycerol-3-phosphate acyltransferase [Xenococcus sp. PCC 7305]